AVASLSHKPIRVDDSGSASSSRRSPKAVVVLQPSVYVIEWSRVVCCHIVELTDRHVRKKPPVRSAIEAFVQTSIAANKVVISVDRVDPDRVIVHVLRPLAKRPHRSPAVVGDLKKHI